MLWERAYEKEVEINEKRAMLGDPGTTQGVEDRQEEFALLQALEKQYEVIFKQIEKQDRIVAGQEQQRARKAERYIQKGGKQIDRA
jgi:hypothetical protein